MVVKRPGLVVPGLDPVPAGAQPLRARLEVGVVGRVVVAVVVEPALGRGELRGWERLHVVVVVVRGAPLAARSSNRAVRLRVRHPHRRRRRRAAFARGHRRERLLDLPPLPPVALRPRLVPRELALGEDPRDATRGVRLRVFDRGGHALLRGEAVVVRLCRPARGARGAGALPPHDGETKAGGGRARSRRVPALRIMKPCDPVDATRAARDPRKSATVTPPPPRAAANAATDAVNRCRGSCTAR